MNFGVMDVLEAEEVMWSHLLGTSILIGQRQD